MNHTFDSRIDKVTLKINMSSPQGWAVKIDLSTRIIDPCKDSLIILYVLSILLLSLWVLNPYLKKNVLIMLFFLLFSID